MASGGSNHASSSSTQPENTYTVRAWKRRPTLLATDYSQHAGKIAVMDVGSWHTRAGWAGEMEPQLDFPSIVSRPKPPRAGEPVMTIGWNVWDWSARAGCRTPYDGALPANSDTMEQVLDHALLCMGVPTDIDHVPHHIMMMEPILEPSFLRTRQTEMLLEGYKVPGISFAADGLAAAAHAGLSNGPALVIHGGHNTTHIMPMNSGTPIWGSTSRVAVGGIHGAEHLRKSILAQLPQADWYLNPISVDRLRDATTYTATDYDYELNEYAKILWNPEEKSDVAQPVTVFFSEDVDEDAAARSAAAAAARAKQAAAEAAEAAEKAEVRKAASRARMVAMAEERRQDKARQNADLFEALKDLWQAHADGTMENRDWLDKIASHGFSRYRPPSLVLERVKELLEAAKDTGVAEERPDIWNLDYDVDEALKTARETEAASWSPYPLLNVPDAELTPEQRKDKKRQENAYAGQVARDKARAQKEAEAAQVAAVAASRDAAFNADPQKFVEELMGRISKLEDAILAAERAATATTGVTGRRKVVDAARLKLLANAAAPVVSDKPRGRGRGGGGGGAEEEEDDGFGRNDADWDEYRIMTGEDLAEAAAARQAQLDELKQQLAYYDPNRELQTAVKESLEEEKGPKNDGVPKGMEAIRATFASHQPDRLILGARRIQTAEILWQPSIIGLTGAGLSEALGHVVTRVGSMREGLLGNVVVTGGLGRVQGFKARLERELRAMAPVGTPISIRVVDQPEWAAWRGASALASSGTVEWITPEIWAEAGGDALIRTHALSNPNLTKWSE